MAATDFYQTLGVDRTAAAAEIQRAYRKLARTYHPDVNKDPDAERRFQDISEAYDVLSDPETRRRYDAFGPDFRQVPPDVDPDSWAGATRARAGTRGPRRTPAGDGGDSRVWVSSGFSDEDLDFDDLLSGLFRRGGRREWGPVAGADQEAELTLSVEDAYRGGPRTITLPGPQGSRTLEVAIPPGVVDGQRIRLAGQGGQGSGSAPPGDLYLIVRLAPHPRYWVAGRDISVDLPLAPWEAALGASVAVETPGGEAKVRVRPGTSSGKRLRLKGRGLPNPRGTPGDLFAEVRIMVPPSLTDKERELFKELAAVSTFDPRRGR
jgi:curved DNA-binding protein